MFARMVMAMDDFDELQAQAENASRGRKGLRYGLPVQVCMSWKQLLLSKSAGKNCQLLETI